jgi:hypothetical protein
MAHVMVPFANGKGGLGKTAADGPRMVQLRDHKILPKVWVEAASARQALENPDGASPIGNIRF